MWVDSRVNQGQVIAAMKDDDCGINGEEIPAPLTHQGQTPRESFIGRHDEMLALMEVEIRKDRQRSPLANQTPS